MSLETDPIYDCAIIGGGAIGLACAWKMAMRGARVVVFDRVQVGREASFAAAGMLAPSCEGIVHTWNAHKSQSEEMTNFCLASRLLYPLLAQTLAQQTGIDIELSLRGQTETNAEEWREPGVFFVAQNEKDARLNALVVYGQSTKWRDLPAVFLPDDGQVENRKLLDALRAAALKNGVEIRESSKISQIEIENGRVVGVSDEKTTTRAAKVLLCTGAWSSKIGGVPAEISGALRPVAGQMVQLRSGRRVKQVIYTEDVYLVPRRDGRLLVGATMEEVGFNKRVTAGGVLKLLKAACELEPELLEAPVEAHWSGLRPVSTDGLPILGPTSLPGLFVATGHGRNGILLTPATALMMADVILEDKTVPAAFSALRWNEKLPKSDEVALTQPLLPPKLTGSPIT